MMVARTREAEVELVEFERQEAKMILRSWKVGITTANGAGFMGKIRISVLDM